MKKYGDLFANQKPVIGVIHLLALPGAPLYDGNLNAVYDQALQEVEIFKRQGLHGIIIENFRDTPFFPDKVPAETIAAIAGISREIVRSVDVPVGINVLRNDGESAIAIACAVQADFVRINVHMNAIVSEQGIIQGLSHKTVRLRAALKSDVLIFADVGVKHASSLDSRGLGAEARDADSRGLADALIVSGSRTGAEADLADVQLVRENSSLPILIGSGATPSNVHKFGEYVNGFIVGSYFKKDAKGNNFVEEARVAEFMRSAEKHGAEKG